MSTKYKIRDQTKLYFISFAVVHWIDVFSRKDYRDIFLDSVKFCQTNKGLEVYAWVPIAIGMSNHVHMIVGSGSLPLEGIIRDLKKFTSSKIIEAIKSNPYESRREWMVWLFERAGKRNPNNTNYQFWQQENHPIELSTNELMEQKLDYIHQNPVATGLVLSAEEYLYSSAKNYAGQKDYLLDVVYLE